MEYDTIVGMRARSKGYYIPAIHDRYLLDAKREILLGRDADAILASESGRRSPAKRSLLSKDGVGL